MPGGLAALEKARPCWILSGMPDMTLAIPEDVAAALRLPPDEIDSTLRKELALTLYQRSVLPMAKAAVLAGMSRWDFEMLLCQRRIERPFSEEDLADDLAFARGFKKESRSTD